METNSPKPEAIIRVPGEGNITISGQDQSFLDIVALELEIMLKEEDFDRSGVPDTAKKVTSEVKGLDKLGLKVDMILSVMKEKGTTLEETKRWLLGEDSSGKADNLLSLARINAAKGIKLPDRFHR